MCKELPVIPVNKVVDPKRIIGKNGGRGVGEPLGVTDTKKNKKKIYIGKAPGADNTNLFYSRFWRI
jgi:hypothetical protein